MAPHFGLGAQAFHRAVEHVDAEVRVDHVVDDLARRQHVDLRLLELDHRTAGVGELCSSSFSASLIARMRSLIALVVFVLHREGDQLRPDGAELDRLLGHALRHLPHGGVLQVAARDRADDAGHHPRFQIVVQDVAGRKRHAAFAGRRRLRVLVEAAHVARRIIGPALAADVRVEMRVAVGDDVEAGQLLLVQIDRDRVDILLAELVVHHGVEEAARARDFPCTSSAAAASR